MAHDVRDFLAELNRATARFLIVGADALAAQGAPLDTLQRSEDDLRHADTAVQLGLPPFRIDLLTGVSGVSFADAWVQRMKGQFGDIRVPFIGRAARVAAVPSILVAANPGAYVFPARFPALGPIATPTT